MKVTCLFDCDNTLIDNDGLKEDYEQLLLPLLGETQAEAFWRTYEDVRHETQVVDYPEIVKRMRPMLGETLADQVWSVLWDYPFAERVFPGALAAIAHMRDLGFAVGILSDGDQLYQPHKIAVSGLASAVGGQMRIYIHKQQHLTEVVAWLPADRTIVVDDRATILADIKRAYPDQFVTVHVLQGHYASEIGDPAPDLSLHAVGDLVSMSPQQLSITQ